MLVRGRRGPLGSWDKRKVTLGWNQESEDRGQADALCPQSMAHEVGISEAV